MESKNNNVKQLLKKYALYLVRWQTSSIILAPIISVFTHSPWYGTKESWTAAVIANLVGGLIFFWIDRWIFRKTDILQGEVWEIRNDIVCADCRKKESKGQRLVKTQNYDKTEDKEPEYRCKKCSEKKYKEIITGNIKKSYKDSDSIEFYLESPFPNKISWRGKAIAPIRKYFKREDDNKQ